LSEVFSHSSQQGATRPLAVVGTKTKAQAIPSEAGDDVQVDMKGIPLDDITEYARTHGFDVSLPKISTSTRMIIARSEPETKTQRGTLVPEFVLTTLPDGVIIRTILGTALHDTTRAVPMRKSNTGPITDWTWVDALAR
jgi:hypothetical protein